MNELNRWDKVIHSITYQEMTVKKCSHPIYVLELEIPVLCEKTGEYGDIAICHIDNLIKKP